MSPNDVNTILVRLDAMHEDIAEIKSEAKATNGRVRALERWQARWEGAKQATAWVQPLVVALVSGGAVAILSAVLH